MSSDKMMENQNKLGFCKCTYKIPQNLKHFKTNKWKIQKYKINSNLTGSTPVKS